jgi:DNA-directed RNA polymerase specialized sigma24 family protein
MMNLANATSFGTGVAELFRADRPATHALVGRTDQESCRAISPSTRPARTETAPEAELRQRRQANLMRRVLSELPPSDQELLSRFYLLKQSLVQICEETGVTEDQFRLVKGRAKARFEELGKQGIEGRFLGTGAA